MGRTMQTETKDHIMPYLVGDTLYNNIENREYHAALTKMLERIEILETAINLIDEHLEGLANEIEIIKGHVIL